jgi:PPK2 family polyphosphate:nucleotide phosphotransferase
MEISGKLSSPFRVEDGRRFRLKDFDPGVTDGRPSRETAEVELQAGVAEIARLQDLLWAQDRWALLLVFQAMDAAGKDSAIKHVMSGVNPQGCDVHAFRQPSEEELDHDYLWRATRVLPERGRIGIFNRSYYEEVLVVRVHPELLQQEKMPPRFVTEALWQQRFQDMLALEDFLSRNGTVVLKFFLHISREEQRRRFLKRLDQPEKNWKFSIADARERQRWDDYMHAYEDMIQHTAAPHAPWYVVPANHKWFSHLVIADVIVKALEDLHMEYPKVTGEKLAELDEARKALLAEGGV